ncbi:MAG: MBL fold metallo-hydrolase [Phycisphaerales bacterium JB039]
MRPIDRLAIDVVVDNTCDMLSTRPAHVESELDRLLDAGMTELAGQSLCCGRHGLSLLVTAHDGDRRRVALFDAGPDPATLRHNAERLGLDLAPVEALVLSHGHFDHSEGLLEAAALVRRAGGRERLPLHAHPGAFAKRADRLADGRIVPLQDVPSPEALHGAGIDLQASDQPEAILDGALALSGEIPRRSFERGLENQVRLTGAGAWEPDPWCMDERFCCVHIRGKGLVILTGCSHAGVVNICAHARELYDLPLYGIIGGLHLVYPNEAFIDETIAQLRDFRLRVIVPGHCTGWRATHALLRAFGPEVVDPLAVGSRIVLESGRG